MSSAIGVNGLTEGRTRWVPLLAVLHGCQGEPFVTTTTAGATSLDAPSSAEHAGPATATAPSASSAPVPAAPSSQATVPPAPAPSAVPAVPGPSAPAPDADAGSRASGGSSASDAGAAPLGDAGPASPAPFDAATLEPACTEGFAREPSSWTLPDPPVSSNWKALERATCTGSAVAHTLLDLDADDRLDLVVLRDCADQLVGQVRWDVYLNEGAAFATRATAYGLPEAPAAYPWTALERKSCTAGTPGFVYFTRDLDGDRFPDLVVVKDCADTSVGQSHWRVYRAQPGGFATTPTPFTLPAAPEGIPYAALERTTCGANNGTGFAYALRDLNGDRALDLLVYDDCSDDAVGQSHWNVYLGAAGGFASGATAWSLPPPPENHPFTLLDRTSCDSAGDVGYAYSLREVTGDGKPDLLVYEDCANPEVGVRYWAVFRGTELGFETEARSLALPPADEPWTEIERASCSQAAGTGFSYHLVDMNGDARPDLLTVLDCGDATVGTSHFDVYLADDAGYDPNPTPWPLPEPAPNQRWSTASTSPCSGQSRGFVLREMDGDGRPDLLVHEDCASALVGLSRWHVYPNRCAPL